jgi:hypothetical protein
VDIVSLWLRVGVKRYQAALGSVRYVIVREKLLFVELSEYSFSKSFLDSFEVYLAEACEDAILPVPVSEEPVKVWMVV